MKPDGRILVMGAGVNGSVCAAALHRAGYDVTVLARGKRLEELQKGVIEIEDPLKGTRTVTQVQVVDRLASEDIYEYILVVVRKNQVRDLLPVLAQNQSQSVVFMVNTASGPNEWIAALGAKRVMLGFVFAGGRREGSLIRAMRAMGQRTPFGEANGAITERLTGWSVSSTAPASGQSDYGHARLACHPRCYGGPAGDVGSQARLRYLRPGAFPEGHGNARRCAARDARRASRKWPPHRSPQYISPRCTSTIRRDELLSRVYVLQICRNWRWLALLAGTG